MFTTMTEQDRQGHRECNEAALAESRSEELDLPARLFGCIGTASTANSRFLAPFQSAPGPREPGRRPWR